MNDEEADARKDGAAVSFAGVEQRARDHRQGRRRRRALRHRLIDGGLARLGRDRRAYAGQRRAAAQQIGAVAIEGHRPLPAGEDATFEPRRHDDDRPRPSRPQPVVRRLGRRQAGDEIRLLQTRELVHQRTAGPGVVQIHHGDRDPDGDLAGIGGRVEEGIEDRRHHDQHEGRPVGEDRAKRRDEGPADQRRPQTSGLREAARYCGRPSPNPTTAKVIRISSSLTDIAAGAPIIHCSATRRAKVV